MKRGLEDSSPILDSPASDGAASESSPSAVGNGNGNVIFGTKDFSPEEHGSMQRLLEQKIPVDFLTTRQGCGRGLFINHTFFLPLFLFCRCDHVSFFYLFFEQGDLLTLKAGEPLRSQTVSSDLMDGLQK